MSDNTRSSAAAAGPHKGNPGQTVVRQATRRMVLACVAAGLVVLGTAAVLWLGNAERIAVAATGQTPAATVHIQTAPSPFFLLFDKKGTFAQAVENPYKDQAGGGISVVEFLSNKGLTALVAEGFGPRSVEVMRSKGIRSVEYSETAAEASKKAVGPK